MNVNAVILYLLYFMTQILWHRIVFLDVLIHIAKNRLSIRGSSFFNNYPKIKLWIISEIIKSFFKEINCSTCYKYLKEELYLNISIDSVQRVYYDIRNVIAKYFNILYQSELLGPKDSHQTFSSDENLFSNTHIGEQIWVLGIVDNLTKDFRLDLSLDRNQERIKSVITQYVESGNTIVTDGWQDYNFLDTSDDYIH